MISGQNHPRKRRLPFRRTHRTNAKRITTGSHALVQAFFADGLDRRTREGRIVDQLELAYARHRGYPSFGACPLPLQDVITMIIGLKIFVATHQFDPASPTGARDFHTALNSLTRLVIGLGLEPVNESEIDLAKRFAGQHHEIAEQESGEPNNPKEETQS